MASPAPSSPLSSLSDYPVDDGDVEIEDEAVTSDEIKRAYKEGVPFFTKEVLKIVGTAIEERADVVEFVGWNSKRQKLELKPPKQYPDKRPIIVYNSYQAMTAYNAEEPITFSLQDCNSPIMVGWTDNPLPAKCSIDEVRESFHNHRRRWLESSNCANLTHILESARSKMEVNKIVCLGLGSVSIPLNYKIQPEVRYRNAELRSSVQHAAVLTMARSLSSHGESSHGVSWNGPIRILAQDPQYNDVDHQILSELGITIVNDPDGFLEVDDKTLVVSVACNVCQAQITADLARPAGMVWNTIEGIGEVTKPWGKNEYGSWVTPFSTDPDSPRVWRLIQDYEKYSFIENEVGDVAFGRVSLYIRK